MIALRPATREDIPALERLIRSSARALGEGFYSASETEAAIAHVFGVDSELIDDGTYLVAETDGALAGCGGWSKRQTLFGGDRARSRTPGLLDPARDAARIRAFFVAPGFARQGVGSLILDACERGAIAAGFSRAALMATLPGAPFYRARGYRPGAPIEHPAGDVSLRFVPMQKLLQPAR